MMKTNHIARLGALALALTLVSTCLMGGTLAKYVTDVEGTAAATVAKWSFDAKSGGKSISTKEYKIDLANTVYQTEGIKEKVIAPGTKGSFDIVVDATGSEVGIGYKIQFSDDKNIPTNLKFYSDSSYSASKEITTLFTPNSPAFQGTINADAVGANKTVTNTVYWQWPYETTGVDGADTADTTAGTATDRNMTFKITVTGTQVTPQPVP